MTMHLFSKSCLLPPYGQCLQDISLCQGLINKSDAVHPNYDCVKELTYKMYNMLLPGLGIGININDSFAQYRDNMTY